MDALDGQVSWSDLGISFGKMSLEPLVQTTEKTSELSSKKSARSQSRMPLFLDLRDGGAMPGASWETGGLLLGEYTMPSFGESPSEENESRLSQILVDVAHPKYSLSARACNGILNRARKRGKPLPEEMRVALEQQASGL